MEEVVGGSGMKTLCMDSAHRHLILVLMEDGEIKASLEKECWKHQSESLFPELIQCMEQAHWQSEDIDEVVITDGPGSYTGVRIAMAAAKVFCTTMQKPLYCISTLQLYAGVEPHTFVMLDARSNRAYCALYDQGILQGKEQICTLDEIRAINEKQEVSFVGDCDLINVASKEIRFAKNFQNLRPFARKIEQIHTLTPRYLKEMDAYQVNK